jgi:hypothetical protein
MKYLFIAGHFAILVLLLGALAPQSVWSFAGTEGNSFLNIPTGGRPAALGGAYSALASDAYAPISNPAGLGFLPSTQLALMHLSYLDSVSYEFASIVHPLSVGHSLGAAVQNLRPGTIKATDINGNPAGDFSGSFFAYSLGYGQTIGSIFSLGVVGKIIQSSIAGYSAHGYAADVGTMLRPSPRIGLSAVVSNIGPKTTFISEGDPLPLSYNLGGFYSPLRNFVFALQGTHANSGLNSGQSGIEWSPVNFVSIRAGYRTNSSRALSSSAGITAGVGLNLAGQKFDYAWAPMGELGNAQYFSMVFQWGHATAASDEYKFLRDDTGRDDGVIFRNEKFPETQQRGLHP